MRVLVATDQWSPDVVGGSARVAADTAHALAARGHEIVVLAPDRAGGVPVERDGSVEVRRVVHRGAAPQTIVDPLSVRRHARAVRDRPFDLVVAHQSTNAVGATSALPDVPLALVFHSSPVLESRFERPHLDRARRMAARALDPVLVMLERRAIARATGILVLSRFSDGLVRGRHPRAATPIHLVGGAAGAEFFAEPKNWQECRSKLDIPSGRLLVTARRLEPRMGVDVLVDAVRLVDDDVVLAVAGSGSAQADLARRVRELGLQRRVRLLGHVSEHDLRSLYAAADLFVLPSVAYEGFGLSTVEALAAGTPVVGTPVGATPEIVRELGPEFVASAADSRSIAAAVGRVLPLLGPDLRARARRLARERYRWETVILRWEKALLSVARS